MKIPDFNALIKKGRKYGETFLKSYYNVREKRIWTYRFNTLSTKNENKANVSTTMLWFLESSESHDCVTSLLFLITAAPNELNSLTKRC